MMGLPLVPTAVIDTNAKAAFYPIHSLKDARFETKLSKMPAPFGIRFDAPNKVVLDLIGNDLLVIENFNDEAIDATLLVCQDCICG